MKVAVCCTKSNWATLANSFAAGVKECGDEPVMIGAYNERPGKNSDILNQKILNIGQGRFKKEINNMISECDVTFQICEGHELKSTDYFLFRNAVKEASEAQDKRRIVLDTPLITVNCNTEERHYSIGYDGMKSLANFYNDDSPDTRRKKREIKIKPWRSAAEIENERNNIVIIGQNYGNFGLKHMGAKKAAAYFTGLPEKIRKYTDQPIIFREHPSCNTPITSMGFFNKKIENFMIVRGTSVARTGGGGSDRAGSRPLSQDLADAACTITKTSAGCIDGIINGVPCICDDPINLAYSMSEHELKNICNPRTPDREQWVNNLVYAEWSEREMQQGIPWKRLREYAIK